MPTTPPAQSETHEQSWFTSVLFWVTLFAAAAAYAGVSLSPKLLTYLKTQKDYRNNQMRMVMLEGQINYLSRVAAALESDPEFSEELARLDFDAAAPDDERIPVGKQLSLSANAPKPEEINPVTTLPWYTPVVATLAEDRELRKTVLFVAMILILVAFTFMQGTTRSHLLASNSPASNSPGSARTKNGRKAAAATPSLFSRWFSRYRA